MINERIYKYLSMKDFHLKSLLKNELFVGTSEGFNDPLDVQPFIRINVREKYAESLFIHAIRKGEDASKDFEMFKADSYFRKEFTSKASSEYIKHLKSSYLVASFTTNPNSNIMWGHYGGCYEGAIIEYSCTKIKDFALKYTRDFYREMLEEDIYELMDRSVVLDNVRYTNKKADLSELVENAIIRVDQSKSKGQEYMSLMREVKLDNDEHLNQMLMMYFYKDEKWKYENEIRLVFQNHNYDKNGMPDIDGNINMIVKPESIRIGYRMEDNKKIKLLEYCHLNNIEVLFSFPSFDTLEYRTHDVKVENEEIPLVIQDFINLMESK